MITIRIKVVLPSDETTELELPLNTDIDQLYARLVTLGVPTTTGRGEPIAYGFYHRRGEAYLPAHISLIDAGIQNGDVVDVIPWPTGEPPAQPQLWANPYTRDSGPTLRRLLRYAWVLVAVAVVAIMGLVLVSGLGGDGGIAPTYTLTASPSPTPLPPSLTPTQSRTPAAPFFAPRPHR